MSVSAGSIDIDEMGIKAEMAPTPFKNSAVQGASWQFGRTVEQVTASRGPCDSVKPLPTVSDNKAAGSAPSVPQLPGGGQDRLVGAAVRWTAADTIGSFRRTAVAAL